MISLKKAWCRLAVLLLAQLLLTPVVYAQPGTHSLELVITAKYNRPVYVDPRARDPEFRKKISDPKVLDKMYRLETPIFIPFKIQGDIRDFFVSEKTEVILNGVKVPMDKLPVPCEARVVFEPNKDNLSYAAKIIVKSFARGASVKWAEMGIH